MHFKPARFRLLSLLSKQEAHSARYNLGMRSYRELLWHVLTEWTFDWRHGVVTKHRIDAKDLDFANDAALSHSERYRPTPPLCLWQAFKWLDTHAGPLRTQHLVDYGCGAGLVLILGQKAGFPRVTGLELSSTLADQCRANLRITARRHRETQWDVLEENAAFYLPPPTASVFYFFNPFSSSYFAEALNRIKHSVEMAPRDVYILVFQATGYDLDGFDEIAWITGVSIFRNKR